MKEIRLDGSKMLGREETHSYLKRKLDLPDYYGNNLDALWDCLSTDYSPRKITVSNADILIQNMGSYGEALIKVLSDAAEENGCIELEIKHRKGD